MEMQQTRSNFTNSRGASPLANSNSVRASDLPQVPTHSPQPRIGNQSDQQIVLPTRNLGSINDIAPSAPPFFTSVANNPLSAQELPLVQDVHPNDFSPSAPLNPTSVIAERIMEDGTLSVESVPLNGSAIVIPQASVHVISDEKSESNGGSIEQENAHLDSNQPVVAPSAPAKADVFIPRPPVAMGGGARVNVPQPEQFNVSFSKSKAKCLKQNISVQDKLDLIIAYIKPVKDQRQKKSLFQVRNNNLASYTPKLRNENDHKDLIKILNKLENNITSPCITDQEVNLLQCFLTYAENHDHKINQDVLTTIKAFLLKNYSAHFPGLIGYSQQVDRIDNTASHLGHLTDLEKDLQDEYNKCLNSNILGNGSFDFGKFFESVSISALTPQARRKIFRLALNLSNEPLNLKLTFGLGKHYSTIDQIDTLISSVIEKRDWPEVMDEMLLYAEEIGNFFKLAETSKSKLQQLKLPDFYTTERCSYGYDLKSEWSKWTCDIILYILENKELHHLFDTQIFKKELDAQFKRCSKTARQDSIPFFLNDYISPKCKDPRNYVNLPLNKFESVLSSAINNQTEYSFKLFEGFFEQIDPAKLNKDVQKTYQGMIDRLLKIAVENKNIDCVKILCDKGANPLCTFKDSIIFEAKMWRGPITYAKIGSPMFHLLMSYIKEDDLNKSLIQISLDLKYRINFLAWLFVTPSTEFENGFTNEDLLNIIETNPIFNSISSECWTNALRLLSSKELNECNIMKLEKSSSGELPKYEFTESQTLQLKGERIKKLKLLMKKGASLTETNLKETIDELDLIEYSVREIPNGTSGYSSIGFAIKSYDKELFDFFMDTAETNRGKTGSFKSNKFLPIQKRFTPRKK